MNNTLIVLPDIEAIAVQYLLTVTAMTDLVDERIYGYTTPEKVEWPYFNCFRFSGRPEPGDPAGYLDHGFLQLAGWSIDRDNAFDICATAVGAMHQIPSVVEGYGVVTAVQDILGPRENDDPETKRPRFIAEVEVTAHPLPA